MSDIINESKSQSLKTLHYTLTGDLEVYEPQIIPIPENLFLNIYTLGHISCEFNPFTSMLQEETAHQTKCSYKLVGHPPAPV